LHGFAGSRLNLGFLRFWMGTGERGNFSGGVKTVNEWFPERSVLSRNRVSTLLGLPNSKMHAESQSFYLRSWLLRLEPSELATSGRRTDEVVGNEFLVVNEHCLSYLSA
jgi:hypothetical protein